MNICGCGGLQKEELRFNEIGIKSEEGMLNFDNSKGVFVFENTKKIKNQIIYYIFPKIKLISQS